MHANTSVATGLQSASKAMGALNKVISYRTCVLRHFIDSNLKNYFAFRSGTNRVSFTRNIHFQINKFLLCV
jgi:hypothetical protein